MTKELERVCKDIAVDGANWTVEAYHSHLPIADRIKIHTRYYDAIRGALWAYEEVRAGLAVRNECLASEN